MLYGSDRQNRIPFARDIQWQNGELVVTAGAKNTKQQVYWVTLNSSTNGHVSPAFILERKRKPMPHYGVPDLIVRKTIMAPGHGHGQLDFWKYPIGRAGSIGHRTGPHVFYGTCNLARTLKRTRSFAHAAVDDV
ncbi:MAG TPA: hypothetical protein VHT92_06205 [Candidatus Cybelea sp.]|nr:hypothetical protein [Candidatus Cybelea sp.]